MRPVRVLLLNLAIIFAGGALLAPLLYWLVQALADTFPELAGKPFRRYVNRSLTLLALLRIWPMLRDLGATRARDIGLASPQRHGRRLLEGLAVGVASFAVVVITVIAAGARTVRDDLTLAGFASHLPGIVPTMIAVALLEEILFRGAIFGVLRRGWHWTAAIAASSLFYAFVHFIGSVDHAGPVNIWSGFSVVAGMFGGFLDVDALVPEFLNLTAAGAILAWGYQRTGNLYFSIGLHAGWVFWVKAYAVITDPVLSGSSAFWGTRKLIDGWIILVALVVAGVLTRLLPANVPEPEG